MELKITKVKFENGKEGYLFDTEAFDLIIEALVRQKEIITNCVKESSKLLAAIKDMKKFADSSDYTFDVLFKEHDSEKS